MNICLVACCAIRLIPIVLIPTWLWIWAALIVCKHLCFPHTVANKLTGFLLFLAAPMLFWSIIPIAFVAVVASFAAVQEGHLIRTSKV